MSCTTRERMVIPGAGGLPRDLQAVHISVSGLIDQLSTVSGPPVNLTDPGLAEFRLVVKQRIPAGTA